MLLKQRQAAAASVSVKSCGADLDITLMLADADPAYEAHVGVLYMWALAVWEAWVPRGLPSIVISHVSQRLRLGGGRGGD